MLWDLINRVMYAIKLRKYFKKIKNTVISSIISVGVFSFVIVLYNLESRDVFGPLRFFKKNELESLDLRFRIRGKRDPGKEIAIVMMDEKSIIKLGRYPWPRQYIAKFVDTIADMGAKVLVFDVIYSEFQNEAHLKSLVRLEKNYFALRKRGKLIPDKYTALIGEEIDAANEDQKLQNSLKRAVMEKGVNIVLGFRFVNEYEQKDTKFTGKKLTQDAEQLLKESAYFPVYVESRNSSGGKTGKANTIDARDVRQIYEKQTDANTSEKIFGVLNAIDSFTQWATYQGFTDQKADYSGKVRSEYLAIRYKEDFYPPIGVQAARVFSNAKPNEFQFWLTNKLVIKNCEIPLDNLNRMFIDYCGPAYTFPTYSFIDVCEGSVGQQLLKDKIVFLGASPFLGDTLATSYTSIMPGVEKQATVAENIIHGKFLKRGKTEALIDIIAIICLCCLLGGILPFVPIVVGCLMSITLLVGYYCYCYYAFTNKMWLNVTYPTTATCLCFFSLSLFRYFVAEKARYTVKKAFENFMDPKVVRELLKEPDTIRLGGEERIVTVFFSDIVKFSVISESLTPTRLIELLNNYLSEMTEIILHHGGYLDKYIGDAIVAVFGTPLQQHDHAIKACCSAIESQKKLVELRKEFNARGFPAIAARIGINSGTVLVGNVGSSRRLSYTVIGDNVNLGARLEGVNKEYGTYTMISEMTYELAKDYIDVRELDIIRVVGKEAPVKIYELIDHKNGMSSQKKEIVELFAKGLESYRKRCWSDAINHFQGVLALDTEDGPSNSYLRRCLRYKTDPPPAGWDGVYSMTSK